MMYEAKLEFPEGWGVIRQIPSVGGMDIFWDHTLGFVGQKIQIYKAR